jgi:succinoglycan biosynthesis transport protein ExoP
MIKVKRIGLSFVINVDLSSLDPVMSARLVNTLADEYIELGLDAKNSNTRRASAWMQQRIGGLHDQAIAADKATQAFKAKAHIVDTEKGLMNERHLGELNSQLVLARAHTADARAKYDRAESILKSGDVTGNVTDALQNEVIIHLREAYVDAANHVSEWRARYGERHQAVQLGEARMRDIQTQISNELRRITQGYLSDYREAVATQQDIERQLEQLSEDASVTNNDLVTLRALQSSADTYGALYANFLQRYTQAVQDQSFPISEARIVTVAMPPLRQSWPKAIIVLAAGLVLGLGFGFAVALVRDSVDRGLRTASQVRAVLGLNCLGLLPALSQPRTPQKIGVTGDGTPRSIPQAPAILRHAANMPLSSYGEAIRGLRIRMIQQRNSTRPANVVGCVSILPGEGKTTVAANFAFFLAQAGFRTLLLDWDLRKPSISRGLAPGAQAGFADVAAGRIPLADAVWRDPKTGLHLLPLVAGEMSMDMLEDASTRDLMRTLRERYDHIIIDLPAVEAVSDAQIAAQLADGLLLIVEWGKTSQDQVLEWLNSGGIDERNVLGVILNKVDMKMLRKYPASTPGFSLRSREAVA